MGETNNDNVDRILSIVDVSKDFGGVKALTHVSADVVAGQIHGIIGPNGAGKTTLLNVISGTFAATSGEVFYKGEGIGSRAAHEIVRMGLCRTFQKAQLLPRLTVLQNVLVGHHRYFERGILRTGFRPPFRADKEEREARDRALLALAEVGLEGSAHRWATDLTWSECQLLQVARAVVGSPEMLLLDEPSAGMGPEESAEMGRIIRGLRDKGMTVMLVSHDMKLVMGLADTITVLNFGEKLFEGRAEEVRQHPKVLEAYLGGEEAS